jgi:hypothetical protein
VGENIINLGYAAGADSGLISVAGNATLGTFNLALSNGGGWVSGSTLLLMQYGGTLTGTPMLNSITFPYPDGSYGSLVNDTTNKQILLTNVVLPEPSVAMAMGVLAMGVVARRGRATRR